MDQRHGGNGRSLFADIYNPLDRNVLYRNGLILQKVFSAVPSKLQEGIVVAEMKDRISSEISIAEKLHISVMRETKPHENLSHKDIIREGYLYTVDIAFKYQGCWVDGAICFPCGNISEEKKTFWNSALKQFLKMRDSYKAPVFFRDWIESSRMDLSTVVKGMGGHGIGSEMHQDPELIYRSPGDILLSKESIFTLEPVFHYKKHDIEIFAYHESTVFYHEDKLHFFPDIKKIFFFDGPC